MGLVEHLEELRVRIVRIVIIISIAFILCYTFSEEIVQFLLAPLKASIGDHGKIIFLGILDKITAQLQISFWVSIIISSPLWFYQLWLFIRPALYPKELKVIRPFLFFGFFLFWLGILFAYYVVFPLAITTLLDMGLNDLQAMLDFKEYLVFSSKALVGFGLLFQLPNVMIILGFMEIVTKYKLREYRRYVIVAFAVIAAIITPPDVVTMMGMWIPMVLLYEVGIIAVALFVHPYLHRKYKNS